MLLYMLMQITVLILQQNHMHFGWKRLIWLSCAQLSLQNFIQVYLPVQAMENDEMKR